MNTKTMPTHRDVLNGATAADFIPDTGELIDKIVESVQEDIADKNDASDAHLIAEGLIETAEEAGYFMPDDLRDEMKNAFVLAVAEDTLSIAEASTKLDEAMLDYFEKGDEK